MELGGTNNLPILTRSRQPCVVRRSKARTNARILIHKSPIFHFDHPFLIAGCLHTSASDNPPRLFHESMLRERDNPNGGEMPQRHCP